MTPKIISYDVEIKSTSKLWVQKVPEVYTNDSNSVEIQFNLIDCTEAELLNSTAQVLLYMRDGSFFQNTGVDVVRTGTTFSYTLKDNEGNHQGLTEVQLVLTIVGTPNEDYASQMYQFKIKNGLGNKVPVETFIQTWETLTTEANAFIAQMETDVQEFDVALESGVLATNIAAKLNNLETTYEPRLLSAEQQLAEIPVEINKGVATHTISNGGAYQRMAVAAITFDDGYASDFTSLKPVMDTHGVKGTIFFNNNNPATGKLTDVQIKQLASEGWEFGSHGQTHSMLSYVALSTGILVGDTTIKIINPTGNGPYIHTKPSGTKLRVSESDIVFTVIGHSLADNVLTLTLATPSAFAVPTPRELYLHEDSVLEEILGPKTYLKSLGIPCDGFAYPWGSTTNSAKRVVQSNFNYGRSATNGVAGTNGGMVGLEEINLKQFELASNELLVMTDGDMDALIAKIVAEKGLLIFLGHTNGWAGLQPKLITAITKLQAAGVPIMPLGEALKYHENTFNFADFNISKNGRMYGADFFLPFNSILGSHGLDYFPHGVSQVRITGGVAKGFPSDAGILTTVFSKGGAFWSYQEWREFDSFRTTNRIFHRTSTGWNSWTIWDELTNVVKKGTSLNFKSLGSQTIPANGKIDVEVSGVTVTNYSTPIVIAQAMHDSVRFTPFISGAKLYVRLENTSSSPVTWEQTLNVTVNETL